MSVDNSDYQPLAPKSKGKKKRLEIIEANLFIKKMLKSQGMTWEQLYKKREENK